MEPLDPILKVTETIKQLTTDYERKNINFDRFITKSGTNKYIKNRSVIKRNFKFFKYFHLRAMKYLKDYRDLLINIHERKIELLKEMEEDNVGRLNENKQSAGETVILDKG